MFNPLDTPVLVLVLTLPTFWISAIIGASFRKGQQDLKDESQYPFGHERRVELAGLHARGLAESHPDRGMDPRRSDLDLLQLASRIQRTQEKHRRVSDFTDWPFHCAFSHSGY